MKKKTILDASFEESRKLVDESYVEEALKVSTEIVFGEKQCQFCLELFLFCY